MPLIVEDLHKAYGDTEVVHGVSGQHPPDAWRQVPMRRRLLR